MPGISVERFQRMRTVVDVDPPYQREGQIWNEGTRSALIDSIINGLDVPKLYFEQEPSRRLGPSGLAWQWAVIDGKQRLESIVEFFNDDLSLATDFVFFEGPEV